MVDFFGRYVTAYFQPNAVQQINLFGREVWRVRAEVKHMILASRIVNFQTQLRSMLFDVIEMQIDLDLRG